MIPNDQQSVGCPRYPGFEERWADLRVSFQDQQFFGYIGLLTSNASGVVEYFWGAVDHRSLELGQRFVPKRSVPEIREKSFGVGSLPVEDYVLEFEI